MAEALCHAMGHEAASAGLSAVDGAAASANAVQAMRERGLDLSHHQARTVREAMLREADLIVCMTEGHARMLAARFPAYLDKIAVMPRAIPDPYGLSLAEYRRCADAIAEGLRTLERAVRR